VNPYRQPPELAPDDLDAPELRRDDQILAALMIAVGGIRVGLAAMLGETFGTEVTIACVIAGIGLALLLASFFKRG